MTPYPCTLSALLAASAMLRPAPPTRNILERPANMVVPFAAGGPIDNVARLLAERHSLGQTVVVENKGAGGTIGTTQVACLQPDGYSVLLMHAGFSTAPSLYKNPGYDPQELRADRLVVDVPMTIIARAPTSRPTPSRNWPSTSKRTRTRSRWPTLASPPATCAAPCWSRRWACNC